MGDFWKCMVTNVQIKMAQVIGDFLGTFEKHNFKVRTSVCGYFLDIF